MKRQKLILALAVSGMLCLCVFLVRHIVGTLKNETIEHAGETVSRTGWILENGDESEKVREHIRVLLLAGIDSNEEPLGLLKGGDDTGSKLWYNYTQADFILYIVFDLKNRTIIPVQLNRDTMCDVTWLTASGKVGGSNVEQLALSHTYGSGGDDSARNVARTVSGLLFGAPVDNYMTVSMSAVPFINDMFGGVSITLEEDCTEIDPAYRKGVTVTLKGQQALDFVRAREHDPVDANLPRMARQRQYLTALEDRALQVIESDSDIVTESYDDLLPYMTSDLNFNSYADYVNWFTEFTIEETVVPEGSYTMGERWAEFDPDMDSLWESVCRLLT